MQNRSVEPDGLLSWDFLSFTGVDGKIKPGGWTTGSGVSIYRDRKYPALLFDEALLQVHLVGASRTS